MNQAVAIARSRTYVPISKIDLAVAEREYQSKECDLEETRVNPTNPLVYLSPTLLAKQSSLPMAKLPTSKKIMQKSRPKKTTGRSEEAFCLSQAGPRAWLRAGGSDSDSPFCLHRDRVDPAKAHMVPYSVLSTQLLFTSINR